MKIENKIQKEILKGEIKMEFLKTREDIAEAINIERKTTVKIDLADTDEYGLVSQKVLIDNGTFNDGTPYLIRSEIRAYKDERKFSFFGFPVGLSNSFGYRDIEEMLEYANAPVVKANSDVVIVIIDSRTKTAFTPFIMHTGKRIDSNSVKPIVFIDENNDATNWLIISDSI